MSWLAAIGLIIYAVTSAFFGRHVASVKGREPVEGLLFGLVFGPLGVLIEAMLPTIEVIRFPVARAAARSRRGDDVVNPGTWR